MESKPGQPKHMGSQMDWQKQITGKSENGLAWWQSKKLTGIVMGFAAFVIYSFGNIFFSHDGVPAISYEAYSKFMDFCTLAVVSLAGHDAVVKGVHEYKNGGQLSTPPQEPPSQKAKKKDEAVG